MPFLRDQARQVYVVALDPLIREPIDGHKRPSAVLLHCWLNAPNDSMSFLTSPRTCRDTDGFETNYFASFDEEYSLGRHNREF